MRCPRTLLVLLLSLFVPCAAAQEPAELPPVQVEENNPLDPLEGTTREVEGRLRELLLAPLESLDFTGLDERLQPGFLGSFPRPGHGTAVEAAGGDVAIELYSGEALPELDAQGFVEALQAATAGWEQVERAGLDVTRFIPVDRSLATALARFTLAGRTKDGARSELHATLEFELTFTPEPRAWELYAANWLDGHRASSPGPRFVDVSDPTGFSLNLAPGTQRLLRELVDDRTQWAIGGLSSLDWNADGRPDLLATRRDQIACLFVNDGRDGFRREPLPITKARKLGACFLFIDLDGDGAEELVPGELTGQAGSTAWLGIYTRRGGEWVHMPHALEFELEGGAREPLVQTLVPADVDGDGQLDLFVGVEQDSRSSGGFSTPLRAFDGGADLLFMNQGGLTFTEEASERGLDARQYTTAATFLDHDADGDPDLFLATAWSPDWLLENDGAGRFEPVAGVPLSAHASIAGGVALDELDGSLALFVTNPYTPIGARITAGAPGPAMDEPRTQMRALAGGSRLFLLDEASGEWRERSTERGVVDGGWGFAPLFFDLDGDGDRDLFVANGVASHSKPELPDFERLQWRQVTADALAIRNGLKRYLADEEALAIFRGSFAGRQRERAFVRAGNDPERFFEASYVLGLDLLQDGRSAVALDYDGDGDLDLASFDLEDVHLLENRGPSQRFALVSLTGGAASVIGAQIEIEAGGRVQRRTVTPTSGHSSQVLFDQHFGLGAAERVDRVELTWASGEREEWTDLPADRKLILRRGAPEAQVVELESWPAPALARPGADMTTRLAKLGGKPGSKPAALATTGRPAVVVCWEPGDEVSRQMLAGLAALGDEHPGRIRIAGVCVGAGDAQAARGEAVKAGARYSQYLSTPEFLASWFGVGEPVTLPSTFVFDATGALRRVVVGVSDWRSVGLVIDSLLDDDMFVEDLVRKAEWQMMQGDGAGALESLRFALRGDPEAAVAHEALGMLYVGLQDLPKAEVAFARAVTIDPDFAEAQFNLGSARLQLGQLAAAITAFEACWKIRGDHADTLVALGSAYAATNRVSDALEAFQRAQTVAPENPKVLYLIGRALVDLDRLAEARASFEAAIELDPKLEAARLAIEAIDNNGR